MDKNDQRIVYINGEYVNAYEATVSVFDRGFRWGDAVYEVERTFAGKVYETEAHVIRLLNSLRYTGIEPNISKQEFVDIVEKVSALNAPAFGDDNDYEVVQVVSRGEVLPDRTAVSSPTVVCYCEPLALTSWAHQYVEGVRLVVPSTRRTPPQSLSPKAKISNKMNHFVAQREASNIDPQAMALLLDDAGNITEAPGGNFLFLSDDVLCVPNTNKVLGGISMLSVIQVAQGLGITVEEKEYTPFDVYHAQEAFVTSTPYMMLPVASLNGMPVGSGKPGPIGKRILAVLSEKVGLDIVDQALRSLPNS